MIAHVSSLFQSVWTFIHDVSSYITSQGLEKFLQDDVIMKSFERRNAFRFQIEIKYLCQTIGKLIEGFVRNFLDASKLQIMCEWRHFKMFHQFLFNLVVRLHIRYGESLENVASFLIKLSTDDEMPLIFVDIMEFGSFLKQNKIFQNILISALVWNKFARIVYVRVGMSLNIVLICF